MKTLFVFPGQGSQYPGMAKDWFDNFDAAKLAFEEASDFSSLDLKKICFDSSDADLKNTEWTQPAILTATIAIYRSLESLMPMRPELVAGHSLGEYSALVSQGILDLGDAAALVRARGKAMQEAVPVGVGGMLALVFRPKTELEANLKAAQDLCDKLKSQNKAWVLEVANINSPEQIVLSGHAEAIKYLESQKEALDAAGVRKGVVLEVSAPFHCSLMKPAADVMAPKLQEAIFNSKSGAYVANVDAGIQSLYSTAKIPSLLIDQITGSVRWVQSMQKVLDQSIFASIEIGPGTVLSGLNKRIQSKGKAFEIIKNIDRLEDFKNAGSKLL